MHVIDLLYLTFITLALCVGYFILLKLFPYFFAQKVLPQRRSPWFPLAYIVLFSALVYAANFLIPDPELANRILHIFGGGFLAFSVCFFAVRDSGVYISKFQFFLFSVLIVLALGTANELLEFSKESMLFKDTKPFYRQISKGCKLCGAGFWSCLFITGKCNANCFYCPTSQTNDDLPTTQGLSFESASAYAEYVNYFKFKGVGFSGGEPFLVFDRVVEFLKKLRKKCAPDLYVWLYTNGILVDEIKLKNKIRELLSSGR